MRQKPGLRKYRKREWEAGNDGDRGGNTKKKKRYRDERKWRQTERDKEKGAKPVTCHLKEVSWSWHTVLHHLVLWPHLDARDPGKWGLYSTAAMFPAKMRGSFHSHTEGEGENGNRKLHNGICHCGESQIACNTGFRTTLSPALPFICQVYLHAVSHLTNDSHAWSVFYSLHSGYTSV